jgi:hypothetical protein
LDKSLRNEREPQNETSSSNFSNGYRRINSQILRRRASMSIFTLTSSELEKYENLSQHFDEKLQEQNEISHLYKWTNKYLRKNSLLKEICFTTNTYETYFQQRNYNERRLSKKLNVYPETNKHFYSKTSSLNKSISKMQIFILVLILIISISIVVSFFRLINKS